MARKVTAAAFGGADRVWQHRRRGPRCHVDSRSSRAATAVPRSTATPELGRRSSSTLGV